MMSRLVMCFGDSLTASGYWKGIKVPDGEVKGQGWVGKRVATIIANARPQISAESPSDVVLLAGVNDIAGGRAADDVCADLKAAWAVIHDEGGAHGGYPTQVIAVLPTPWYGYTGGKNGVGKALFFNSPVAAPRLKAMTEAVRRYIVSMLGDSDGPDLVVDTASLGDSRGQLLARFSHDGLHMNGRGYATLAGLVQAALTGSATAAGGFTQTRGMTADIPPPRTTPLIRCVERGRIISDVADIMTAAGADEPDNDSAAVVTLDDAALREQLGLIAVPELETIEVASGDAPTLAWPPKWRLPTTEILREAKAAAEKYDVPLKIILGVIQKESSYKPKLKGGQTAVNNKKFRESYEKRRNDVIPGRNPKRLTWGQVFSPADWTAFGLMQVLPYNIYGKFGIPVGAPVSALYGVKPNIQAGAAALAGWYKYVKGISWDRALKFYNGSTVYVHMVADHIAELEKSGAIG
jgi:hypothetical protein